MLKKMVNMLENITPVYNNNNNNNNNLTSRENTKYSID